MVVFSRKLCGFGVNTEPGFVSLHASRGHVTTVANFSTHLCGITVVSCHAVSPLVNFILPNHLSSGKKTRKIIFLLFYFSP